MWSDEPHPRTGKAPVSANTWSRSQGTVESGRWLNPRRREGRAKRNVFVKAILLRANKDNQRLALWRRLTFAWDDGGLARLSRVQGGRWGLGSVVVAVVVGYRKTHPEAHNEAEDHKQSRRLPSQPTVLRGCGRVPMLIESAR